MKNSQQLQTTIRQARLLALSLLSISVLIVPSWKIDPTDAPYHTVARELFLAVTLLFCGCYIALGRLAQRRLARNHA